MASEKLYSKAETRKRLGIGRIRYEQFLRAGILPQPFSIVEGARPVHSESQIQIAENNLYRQAVKNLTPERARKMKPLSEKFIKEITG